MSGVERRIYHLSLESAGDEERLLLWQLSGLIEEHFKRGCWAVAATGLSAQTRSLSQGEKEALRTAG